MEAVAITLPFFFKLQLCYESGVLSRETMKAEGSEVPCRFKGTLVRSILVAAGTAIAIQNHITISLLILGRVPRQASAAHHFGREGSQPGGGWTDGPRPPPLQHSLQHTTENIEGILPPCSEAATNSRKEAPPDCGADLH